MDRVYGKGINKRIRFFITVGVVAVAAIALIVIAISFFSVNRSVANSIIVYSNDNGKVVRIGNLETTVSDPTASDFKSDNDNDRVFYTVSSAYSDGLYDLYYVERNRSELTSPKIIDYGIEKDYIFASGKIYYLKNNPQAGAKDAFCCDFSSSTIESISSNVESIYPIEKSNTIYFIKLHGSERVLYKYSVDVPIEVSRNITDIYLFNKSETPHIFYEKESKIYNGMTELYRAEAEGAPELVCDNAYQVMYDEYSPDGNLYYFTSSTQNISWSYVIADAYEETDKTITRPKRDSFLSVLGISVEYNEALREYQDKLVRDEIRAALNESVEKGEFSAPIYTAYAYNSEGNHKIAENINPDYIFSVSPFGTPKIIFESSEVIKSSTDMGTLVDIAQRSSMSEVIEYARSIVDSSIKKTGICIAGCGEMGAFDHPLEGYDKEKTLFSFSKDGNRVFALVRDSAGDRLRLYSCMLGSDFKPSEKININNGISSYYFIDNSVIYLKSDVGKNTGDVYKFSDEENVKLSNAVNALMLENGNNIIVLKDYDNSTNKITADYYIVNDSNEELISENILVDSFVTDGLNKAAYITSSEIGSDLYIFSQGKNSYIVSNASDIILLN